MTKDLLCSHYQLARLSEQKLKELIDNTDTQQDLLFKLAGFYGLLLQSLNNAEYLKIK